MLSLLTDGSRCFSGLQGDWCSGYAEHTGVFLEWAWDTNTTFLSSAWGFQKIKLIASFNIFKHIFFKFPWRILSNYYWINAKNSWNVFLSKSVSSSMYNFKSSQGSITTMFNYSHLNTSIERPIMPYLTFQVLLLFSCCSLLYLVMPDISCIEISLLFMLLG